MPAGSTVVILGANGYLGSSLCRLFHRLPSHRVVAVARSAPTHAAFDDSIVADTVTNSWADKIEADGPLTVFDCAFDFAGISKSGHARKYRVFEQNLASLSARESTRLINISTISAYPGCRSDYGREKLFIEEMFRHLGGISVRPGFIVSWRKPGSAFLRLVEIVKISKIVPVILARGSGYYVCDLEAVLLGLYSLTATNEDAGTLSFVYERRLPLRDMIALIENRLGLSRIKVPVPWPAVYAPLLAKEMLLGKSKVRADSVIDFANPAPRAEGRDYFAGLLAAFRSGLEKASGGASQGFYFLEPRGLHKVPDANASLPLKNVLSRLANT